MHNLNGVSCSKAETAAVGSNRLASRLCSRKRRGAINAKQLSYLEKYRPKSRLRLRNGHRQCTLQ